jgi:dihydroorotase
VQTVTIRDPIDFHVHLRGGDLLRRVAPETARVFGRALVMPNSPAVRDADELVSYRADIVAAAGPGFEPLVALKLTPRTTPETIRAAHAAGAVAAKLYPAGVTTASDDGIDLNGGGFGLVAYDPLFRALADVGMVLCVHGEVPRSFCLDREAHFVFLLNQVVPRFPGLRVVLEHVTTWSAIRHVMDGPENLAATITAHHLAMTLDDVIGDRKDGTGSKLRPHNYCLPVAKRPEDRAALRDAATSGHPRVFFGSDSAPHERAAKESACGCAGCFTAPVALPTLAEVFEDAGELHRLEDFAGRRGAAFYGLDWPRAGRSVTLRREPWTVPAEVAGLVPWRAGETPRWRADP